MIDLILGVENLKKYFETSLGVVRAVDEVTFSVSEAETFGLVGESGSGKSTTGHVIVGIYRPTSGRITYKGEDISAPLRKRSLKQKKEIQMVFQDPRSSLNPMQTVREIVELPLKIHLKHLSVKDREAKVRMLLEEVGLLPEDFMNRFPRELGGGESQLVAIARALASEPSFIVLDEPTSALDVSIQAKIINVLLKLQREHKLSYLFITHDLSLMRNISNRVAIMYLGKIYEKSTTERFFINPLHPYTKMLLSSVPVLTEEEERMKPKEVRSSGEIPS
ncbi:MAG: ATP-binding cassette domain-containing protein, partial [Candidatus Korarchaeum sp.]|nr:ATP-binding cassette domain-containing protein [Candidatus Korarchaeum sp.]